MSLQKGEIETYINTLVELHFYYIRDEIKPSDGLFEAIQKLVVTKFEDSDKILVEIELNEDQVNDFNLVFDIYSSPVKWFKSLNLSVNDLPEVRFAVQFKLFKCMMSLMVERQECFDKQWLITTNNILRNDYESLSNMTIIKNNDYKSYFRYSCIFFFVSAFTLGSGLFARDMVFDYIEQLFKLCVSLKLDSLSHSFILDNVPEEGAPVTLSLDQAIVETSIAECYVAAGDLYWLYNQTPVLVKGLFGIGLGLLGIGLFQYIGNRHRGSFHRDLFIEKPAENLPDMVNDSDDEFFDCVEELPESPSL